jgi:GNAT superfamily N-acetyltransferase
MTGGYRIRPARPEDVDLIVRFNRAMARETEGRDLEEATIAAGVEALLADPSKGRYFLAERRAEVAGQLMVTPEWSDWRNGPVWWIQSVYVAPAHRRRGV